MRTYSSENSQLVRTECLESSRRDTDRGKLQGVCGKDQLENKLKAVPLQPCKQEVRSNWSTRRWVLFEEHVLVPKHVTLSQKIRLALLVSIPLALLTSSEVLSCAHQADMSLDKCQLVPVRIPSLFEQNVLNAVGRTQIEGSCKVYEGKTNWIASWKLYRWSLASKNWGAIEATWQMTPIRAAFTCCKACDIVGEDEFALLASIPAFCFSIKRQCMTRTQMAILEDSKLRLEELKTVTFSFWTLQEDHTHHTKWPSLILLNLSRASYMFGRIDIKWATLILMRARGRYGYNFSLRLSYKHGRKQLRLIPRVIPY